MTTDLNGNAPDCAGAALVIIDMINDLEFAGSERLLPAALAAARRIAELKTRAKEARVPVIFANDNFGRWRSDFHQAVAHCLEEDVPGRPLVEQLRPDQDDYYVLKPRHSAFYATPLELLLQHLQCRRLILCGMTGDMCVQFTASDAYMRQFKLQVPADCVASASDASNRKALEYMEHVLRADIRPSGMLDLDRLQR